MFIDGQASLEVGASQIASMYHELSPVAPVRIETMNCTILSLPFSSHQYCHLVAAVDSSPAKSHLQPVNHHLNLRHSVFERVNLKLRTLDIYIMLIQRSLPWQCGQTVVDIVSALSNRSLEVETRDYFHSKSKIGTLYKSIMVQIEPSLN